MIRDFPVTSACGHGIGPCSDQQEEESPIQLCSERKSGPACEENSEAERKPAVLVRFFGDGIHLQCSGGLIDYPLECDVYVQFNELFDLTDGTSRVKDVLKFRGYDSWDERREWCLLFTLDPVGRSVRGEKPSKTLIEMLKAATSEIDWLEQHGFEIRFQHDQRALAPARTAKVAA